MVMGEGGRGEEGGGRFLLYNSVRGKKPIN